MPIDIASLTLAEFLQEEGVAIDSIQNPFDELAPHYSIRVGERLRDLSGGHYSVHRLETGQSGDVALLCDGELAGFYAESILAIDDAHRGKRLSGPLIIEAYKFRFLPIAPRKLSLAGKSALTNAWNVASGLRLCEW